MMVFSTFETNPNTESLSIGHIDKFNGKLRYEPILRFVQNSRYDRECLIAIRDRMLLLWNLFEEFEDPKRQVYEMRMSLLRIMELKEQVSELNQKVEELEYQLWENQQMNKYKRRSNLYEK